jgi:hypothetical protein
MNIPFSGEKERLTPDELALAADRVNTAGQGVMLLWQAVSELLTGPLQAVTPNTSTTQPNVAVREQLPDSAAIANTAIDGAARFQQAEQQDREARAAAARQAAEDAREMMS